MNPKAEPGKRALLLAEVALTAVTVSAVLGLGRLFVDASFLPPVLLFGVAAHVFAALLRRAGVGALGSTAAGMAGLAIAISWLLLPETTTFGIPTGETLAQAGRELRAAWSTFTDVVAPAPVDPGFVLAAAAGAWVLAFTADTAAFRTGAVVEAAVPGATLFVFGAALGAPRYREAYTAAFLVSVLAYWLAQRALAQAATPTWLARDTREAPTSLLRAGAWLALVGVLAAAFVGPRLPGADAAPVIPWRASDRDDDGRVTVSPLVDIKTRIVDQADVEVFRVRTDTRSYWRLTSLEEFDGRIWSSNGSYRPADGELESAVATGAASSTAVTQEFTIKALASIWLPAAFRAVSVEGTDARYDPDSNSLLTERETSDGLVYTVTSELPRLTPDQLLGAPSEPPADVADVYSALPADFSPRVRELAQAIVAGAPAPYDRARRLQDYFRDGTFTYDLTVGPGHDGNAIEAFLFDTRTGYCEQFAGAYAAMARAVGLPTRVAVGFTPGQRSGDEYVVRGENGHAWPEVYLGGFGWVAFEPTPGRGIPGGEAYTGVPEQQAPPGEPNSATTLAPTTTVSTLPGTTPTTTSRFDLSEDVIAQGEERESPWPLRLAVAAAVLVLLPVAWAGAVLLGHVWRRRRRRAAAESATARVAVAWAEVGEALTRAGTPARPSETPAEYAARAAAATGTDERLLARLAAATAAASWSATGPDDRTAAAAVEAAAVVEDDLDARLSRGDRVRRAFDPRPLLPERRERVVIS